MGRMMRNEGLCATAGSRSPSVSIWGNGEVMGSGDRKGANEERHGRLGRRGTVEVLSTGQSHGSQTMPLLQCLIADLTRPEILLSR